MEKAIKQQELDAKLQMQEKERQARLTFEKEIKEKELEMKERELDAKIKLEQDKLGKQSSSNSSGKFDATKKIRLVPKF